MSERVKPKVPISAAKLAENDKLKTLQSDNAVNLRTGGQNSLSEDVA